ncbi:DMT family transporter [Lichenicola cladoniae]|uniref:DMT family transporter n=1 Tax=Lichenicola cladoniae TaxID=1484109 RepID=A0A6M8HWL7_9PROT|nr:DMT family transporter [Acetobacteraceae bacterium]QKE92547.1 DMT family transporter [Lichenicola cladoniae]
MARGVLLAFIAFVAYSLSDASVKLLAGSIPAFELVFLGAALGLLAVPMVKGADERWSDLLRCRSRLMWCLRAVAAVAGSVFSVIAFTMLSMAEAMALLFLMPAFVTILSVIFLKEPVGWRRWSAVLVGFLGVLIVLRPGLQPFTMGHLAAILGALAGAVTIVILRALGPTEKRISLYGAGLIGPIVASFLFAAPHLVMPTPRQWIFVLGYGLLAAAGNILLQLASEHAPASQVAPAQYSQMLWAVALDALLFGIGIDLPMILGSIVIIGAGLFTFERERIRKPRWWNRHPLIRAR